MSGKVKGTYAQRNKLKRKKYVRPWVVATLILCEQVEFIKKAWDGWVPYLQDEERSFRWGTYDLVVDAVWSVLTFTHGLCYWTFHELVNSHHVFQRVMESLFTQEILFRW